MATKKNNGLLPTRYISISENSLFITNVKNEELK